MTHGDCSHETERCLLLERKVMTNLDIILKSRDITLPTKVHLVKAVLSPVVMDGCESWTIKTAERWRIDAFELWCWRRLLRVSWTVRRSNLSILKEINPEYSLEGLMLKLKLLHFWPPDEKKWLIWKYPDAGKIEGRRRRGWDGWMASPTQQTWLDSASLMDREAWRDAVHGVAKSRTWLSSWTELNWTMKNQKEKLRYQSHSPLQQKELIF